MWFWLGSKRGSTDCKEVACSNFHVSSYSVRNACNSIYVSKGKDSIAYEENNERKIMLKAMILLFNFCTNVVGINKILNFSWIGLSAVP